MTLDNTIKNKISDIITKTKTMVDNKISNHNNNSNAHSTLFDSKIDVNKIRNNLNTLSNSSPNDGTVLSAYQGYLLDTNKLDKPEYNTSYPDSTYLKQYLSIDTEGNIVGAPIFLDKISNQQSHNNIKEGESNNLTLTNQAAINMAIDNKFSFIDGEIVDIIDFYNNLFIEQSDLSYAIEELNGELSNYIKKDKLKYLNGRLYVEND